MKPAAARVIFGAGILVIGGCGAVLGIDSDRYIAASEDAAAEGGRGDAAPAARPPDGGSPAANWDCLSRPPEEIDPSLQVTGTLLVIDPIPGSIAAGAVDGGSDLDTVKWKGLAGVSVRDCALLDTKCSHPGQTLVTDDAGAAVFALTGDFSGYFDMRRADLLPATLYPGNLLAGSTLANFPTYDLNSEDIQQLAKLANVNAILDPDAGVGHLAVTIYDCVDHQAPGVSVAIDQMGTQGVPFYFKGGLPSTEVTQTDSFGLAGAVNVPVGTRMAAATLASNGAKIGTITFDVRPGSLTFAWIRVRSH
jgi:hypothetical protein